MLHKQLCEVKTINFSVNFSTFFQVQGHSQEKHVVIEFLPKVLSIFSGFFSWSSIIQLIESN